MPLYRAASAAFASLPPTIRGVVYMLLAAVCYTITTMIIRVLTRDVHVFEIAFFRNLFGLIAMWPLVWRAGMGSLRTSRLGLHGARTLLNLLAMVAFFHAIITLPLADATAINFAMPLFVSVGAVLVLGEIMRIRRWTAVIIGFIGVLIVVRPSPSALQLDARAALVSALSMAVVVLIVKVLARTESPNSIVVINLLMVTPISLIAALFVWTTPSMTTLGLMAVHGSLGTFGQLFLTRALAVGDASLMTPFEFVRLPMAGLGAWFVFGEVADIWTWVGGAVIFASTAYIAQREANLHKRRQEEDR